MSRGGWAAVAAVFLFFAACVAVAIYADWQVSHGR